MELLLFVLEGDLIGLSNCDLRLKVFSLAILSDCVDIYLKRKLIFKCNFRG